MVEETGRCVSETQENVVARNTARGPTWRSRQTRTSCGLCKCAQRFKRKITEEFGFCNFPWECGNLCASW